jgi:hypothetical protein
MSTLQCQACNATIQNGARFCGRCGKYIDVDQGDTKPLSIDQHLADRSGDLSTVEDGWNWQPVEEDSPAPFSLEVALPPLLGAAIGPSPASVPVVQGSPQMGGVPSLQGTPQAPGGAIPPGPAPLQQAPAGTGATSAAPNAPPVSSKHISQHHRQRRWFRKHHKEKPRHQPSHHLHHSGPLHHSGALHTHSQTLPERTGRIARKSLKHAGRWHIKSVLMAMVGIVVIGGLSVLFLLPVLRSHAQPAATLLLNGSVVPGGSVALQGRNFTPGGTITFTIDGHTASAAGSSSATQARSLPVSASASQASLVQVVQQVTKAQARGGSILVKADGSFETTIQIDPNWPVGSSHVLVAMEQSSGQQARLAIMIPHPAQLTSCASATATTSIVLGPVTEGQAQPVSTGFTLCTQGSGIVQWSANWNQRQAKWLQIEQSGNIQAPLSKQVTISASASGLKAGSYNAIVTFTDQHGLKVSLQVTFLVRPAGATACLNTSQQSLTFSATLGLASPAAQQVTLTNCGVSDSWTATAHTDDGANWLSVSPTSGQLNAKASSAVSIAVASSALAQGIYTGQVTMKTGSGIAVVNVTLNVQPSSKSPSCMSIAPQSLTFSATQGQGNPAAQSVTIGNCGPAAGWSASASTTDGANWLTINPAKGNLSTNTSDNVFIAVSGAGLQIGTYTGQVTFTMGSSKHTVSVSFTIVQQQPKPCLQVSSASLPFTATQGQGDPAPQTVTLTNCGPDGSWSTSTANNSPWHALSPVSNTLSAGASQNVTVSASIAGLRAGTYNDSIGFALMTSAGGTRQTVTVTLTVQPPPPCISASSRSLAFTGTQGQADPPAQTVTLTNCGADGSWSASTANGSSWLTINPTSNTLSAGASHSVSVGVSLTGLKAGTYTDSIAFTITTGTGTSQATVAVSLAVHPPQPPCLQISPASLTFSATQGQRDPAPQIVTLTNCGTDGSWSASTTNGSRWLTINPTSSALSAGTSQSVTVSTSIAELSAGTYNDTITFTLTNSGGTAQQTVAITLTVLPAPCLSITSTTPQASSGVIYVYAGSTASVTVNNCGSDTGTLSSADGASWLTDNLQQGTSIASGGTQTITISTASSAPPGGTGTVTITLTTRGGQTSVTIMMGILSPIQ